MNLILNKIAVLFCFLLLSQPILAGDRLGNGGDVVFCSSGQPFKAKLLDFYEAKFFDHTYRVALGSPKLSLNEKVRFYLKKLGKVNKKRAKLYEKEYKTFFDKTLFVRDTELTDVPDSNHVGRPTGCEIKQIAIQGDFGNNRPDKEYIIDEDLWDLLDVNDKVGLIFHEIIYKEALKLGHTDSVNVRTLNSWIASRGFKNVGRKEFNDTLLKLDFPTLKFHVKYPNLFLKLERFNSLGDLVAIVSHQSTIESKFGSIPLKPGTEVEFLGSWYITKISCKVMYGNLRGESSFGPFQLKIRDITHDFYNSSPCRHSFLDMTEAGIPRYIYSKDVRSHPLKTPNGIFNIRWGGEYGFLKYWGDGQVEDADLVGEHFFKLVESDEFVFASGSVGFHPNGKVWYTKASRPFNFEINSKPVTVKASGVVFHSNGRLRFAKTDDQYPLNEGGQNILLTQKVALTKSGEIKEGIVADGQYVQAYGQKRRLKKGSTLGYDYHPDAKNPTRKVQFEEDETFNVGPHSFTCTSYFDTEGYEYDIEVEFHKSWTIQYCEYFNGPYSFELFGKTFSGNLPRVDEESQGSVSFYEGGGIDSLYLVKDLVEVIIRGKTYESHSVDLHPNGQVSFLFTVKDSVFQKPDGSLILVVANTNVYFDEHGFVKKTYNP